MKTAFQQRTATSLSGLPHTLAKRTPVLGLVQLDEFSGELVRKAFAQCGIQAVQVGEDFAARVSREKFEGLVLTLDQPAIAILEAIRSSPSNRRTILYGIARENLDIRPFSQYGINAFLDLPLDRAAVVGIARATCALLLQELRRYVRIPLVVEVTIESGGKTMRGSSREISGGGMSIHLPGGVAHKEKLRLLFALPGGPMLTIAASVCWKNESLLGFQFEDSDSARQAVKSWIDSFLALQ
jgi:PilZ domain-containing protein